MVQVKFLGSLREVTGVAREEVGAARVGDVLRRVSEEHGSALREMLFIDGNAEKLSKDVDVLVNGRSIAFLQGLETSLEKEDQVTVLYHGIRGFPGG